MTPDRYCEKLTRESGSSFYWSFKVLPPEKRSAFYSVYAFCRHTDDIVDALEGAADDGHSVEIHARKSAALDAWQCEFDRSCDGKPTHPITISLGDKMHRFGIPRDPFDRIIEGVRMDLCKDRYDTFQDLYEYCYRVASAPGIACIHILGFRNDKTPAYAENLGVALQLTNIIRDMGEDAARGRIYLPQEDLARYGCSERDIIEGRQSAAFVDLMQFQCRRAREYFERSRACLTPDDRRAMICPEIMSNIYASLLEKIERTGFQVFGRRIGVPTAKKILLALRTWATSRFRK